MQKEEAWFQSWGIASTKCQHLVSILEVICLPHSIATLFVVMPK
jgi:hypothetical protein